MDEQTSVSINEDGGIVIRHSSGETLLHPGREEEFAGKFRELSEAQKNLVAQALIERDQEIPEAVRNSLQPDSSQKNVVWGNISHVGSVRIGDSFNLHLAPAKLPAALTLNIPKTDPAALIGRENDLEELNRLLATEDGVVVNGLGGIGKTALAQAYLGKYTSGYRHIAWITQTTGRIVDDLINTKGLISILGIDAAGLEPDQLFEKIILKLKAVEDGPNLLVIDNAEQPLSDYRHLLPGHPGWHVLVTSREDIDGFYTKRLGFLSPEQAVQLFRKHYTLKGIKDSEVAELVEAVDYHTLTIEILAKTAKLQRYDPEKLKQAIFQDLKANIMVDRQAGQVERIGSYLSTVFNLSGLEAAELWLMKQFACLPSEFHSYGLVRELTVTENSSYTEQFAETISNLAEKGWLLYNEETDSYKMHRIIAAVVKKQYAITLDDVGTLAYLVSDKLSIDKETDNPVEKFPWIPFGKILLESLMSSSANGFEFIKNNLALVLKEAGDYKEARKLLQETADFFERDLGTEHVSTAIVYLNLSQVLRELRCFKEAKSYTEKALLVNERNYGPENPLTVRSYSDLALLLRDLGDYEGAKTLMEKVVRYDEKNFGPDHPVTSKSWSNLAMILRDLHDYEAAKILLEKAVRFDEKYFGPDHPLTVRRYGNLGAVFQSLGDLENAKAYFGKAVHSGEKCYGPEHPALIVDYSLLGITLTALNELEDAKKMLEKAIRSGEKNFGPDHAATNTNYGNLAIVLQLMGSHEEAKRLMEKTRRFDEEHPDTEDSSTGLRYFNLGFLLKQAGQYEEALGLYQKAESILKKTLPEDHPYLQNLSIHYSNLKSLVEANSQR